MRHLKEFVLQYGAPNDIVSNQHLFHICEIRRILHNKRNTYSELAETCTSEWDSRKSESNDFFNSPSIIPRQH